jgi:anti-anti-sigma factor
MLTFDYNSAEKVLTCHFTGRLDTNTSVTLCDEMCGKINSMKGGDNPDTLLDDKIIFDMTGVNYIASSFIRICVNSAKQVHKGNFSIINCDPFLKKTFKIAGLDDLLNVK